MWTLAWIAADRAVASAQRSGDPLLEAQAKRRLANALMRHGWLDEAGALCSNATDRIVPTDATPLGLLCYRVFERCDEIAQRDGVHAA